MLYKTFNNIFYQIVIFISLPEKLFVHPNTLRYRLNKIEQITGLFFNKIDDKLTLYLGTLLEH